MKRKQDMNPIGVCLAIWNREYYKRAYNAITAHPQFSRWNLGLKDWRKGSLRPDGRQEKAGWQPRDFQLWNCQSAACHVLHPAVWCGAVLSCVVDDSWYHVLHSTVCRVLRPAVCRKTRAVCVPFFRCAILTCGSLLPSSALTYKPGKLWIGNKQ